MHCKIQFELQNTHQQVVQSGKISFKFAISYLGLFPLLHVSRMGHGVKTEKRPMCFCYKQISEPRFQEHQAISLFHMVSLSSYKISIFINLPLTALHLFQASTELADCTA